MNRIDTCHTTVAAAYIVNSGFLGKVYSVHVGLRINQVASLLDSVVAEGRRRGQVAEAAEGLRDLVVYEPHRVPKLLKSVESGRVAAVVEALIEYVPPVQDDEFDSAAEALKDEASADAEHYGY